MNHTVRFSDYDLLQAGVNGVVRQISAIKHRRPEANGRPQGDPWSVNIGGSIGELVVSKWLDRYWDGAYRVRLTKGDVGDLEVRYTDWPTGRLLLHDYDEDEHVFLLVTGPYQRMVFTVRGWLLGHEGKREEWMGELEPGRPCYAVPQSALHPAQEIWETNASEGARLRARQVAAR